MRKYVLYIFLTQSLICVSQKSINGYQVQSIGLLTINLPSVVHGQVTSLKNKIAKVKVINWYKNDYNYGKKVKIRDYSSRKSEIAISEEYGLELNQEYIFILGTQFSAGFTLPLRAPEYRFKVINDSIFIPKALLWNLNQDDLIIQQNTFNDPLFHEGMKISVIDFKYFVDEMNATFIYKRAKHNFLTRRRRMYPKCFIKIKEIDSTANTFVRSSLEELNKYWLKKPCD